MTTIITLIILSLFLGIVEYIQVYKDKRKKNKRVED
jgi:Flp pilus assembly protein TadG